MRRICLTLLLVFIGTPVLAHSNTLNISPNVDKTFASAPPELRMTFTEALEPDFSTMTVYDNQGNHMELPLATVPEGDAKSLILDTSSLGAGVYTVSWRVVSAMDGHPTEGSFPLRIASNATVISDLGSQSKTFPVDSAILRALNLLSLALLMGAVAFPVLIWKQEFSESLPQGKSALIRYFQLAWLLFGLSSFGFLLLQAKLFAGSWQNALSALPSLLTGTRFGYLWLTRMGLWLVLGLVFTGHKARNHSGQLPLLLAFALLLLQSLMSHASGVLDSVGAITTDWLHLVAVGIWLGGLVAFFTLVGTLRKNLNALGEVTARFSNMARLAVAMLILTGTYSAWLQIGSLDALLYTAYGQALIVKLLLFLPLMGIGTINLFLTNKSLHSGNFGWSEQLKALLGAEIALTLGILAAVGGMTAIEPARTAYQPSVLPPQPEPFLGISLVDNMMIRLTIEPNLLGENNFYVDLFTQDISSPIEDVSKIIFRFEQGDINSEIEALPQGGGRFLVSRYHLKSAGDWLIRLRIEQPNLVSEVSFNALLNEPAPAPQDLRKLSRQDRMIALLITGITSLLISLILLWKRYPNKLILGGVSLLASLLLLASGLFLLVPQNPLLDEIPTKIVITEGKAYILTQSGKILQPSEDGYRVLAFDLPVNDLLAESNGTLWMATDQGLYRDEGGLWTLESNLPVQKLLSTQGFLLALGEGEIYRLAQGNILHDSRLLLTPVVAPVKNFVMLSNYTHVALNGTRVYLTTYLGLDWTDLNAPVPIEEIGTDEEGNLLALSAESFWQWNWQSKEWLEREALPLGVSDWSIFNARLYVLADGLVYREEGDSWQLVTIEAAGRFIDIAYQYPDSLWLLEENGSLWRQRLSTETWRKEA